MSVDKQVVKQQLHELGDFHRFFTSREVSCLHEVLTGGEVIHAVTSGFFDGHTWIVVVSNIRILFLDKGMFYGLKQVDMPLNKISSISQKTGFFFGEIEVASSSGSKKITSIPKRNVLKVSSILAGLIHGDTAKAAPLRERATDLATQFEKLDSLHQKGALTDDEFRMSKAKLLSN